MRESRQTQEQLSRLTDDEREHFLERAAIMQHDGEMTMADAERAAWEDIFGGVI